MSGTRSAPRHIPGRAARRDWHSAARRVLFPVAGAALLYAVMAYLVLPWANPLMNHMTPRVPLLIGHLIYGLVFGLVVHPLARRATAARG